jgi:predicted NBD/HSP70 family sugar kinase
MKSIAMKQTGRKGERDKRLIEAVVRRFAPISRVGIHQVTNLRRTTISQITRELLEEGRLLEVGRSNNPLGRKQILLQLNPKFGYIIGVEFDDEVVAAGVMDLAPSLLHLIHEPADLKHGMDGLLSQLQFCVMRAIRESKIDPALLLGIGIADPGLVDSRRGITLTSSTIDFWQQAPLKKLFEEKFGIATTVESKTRAKTIAERILGSGKMQDNLIYVDYGAGIGAGVVVDGLLLYGHNCGVGELGHIHISNNGPACRCGSIGCLEAMAGTAAIEARIRQALTEGAGSQVVARVGGDSSRITAWDVFSAARAGDKMCGNIVTELGDNLGIAIAKMVNLFNPSIVVFDKRLELAGDALLEQIGRIVRAQALASSTENLTLKLGSLGEEVGILGIGLAVLEKHFELPERRFLDEVPEPDQPVLAHS